MLYPHRAQSSRVRSALLWTASVSLGPYHNPLRFQITSYTVREPMAPKGFRSIAGWTAGRRERLVQRYDEHGESPFI